jgi:hypothetical protein
VVLVVVLVVLLLVAGAVVGDFVVRHQVERQVASRLQTTLGTPAAPSVDVGGFPFAPQALRSDIDQVHVVADEVGANGGVPLEIRHIDVILHHVTSDDRFATATAGTLDGTAQIDLAALAELTGRDLTYAGAGRVQFRTDASVLGRNVTVVVSGRPQVDAAAQTITLADADVTVADVEVPKSVVTFLQRTLVKPMPITGVPLGLRVVGLTVGDDGVDVHLQGEDVKLSG